MSVGKNRRVLETKLRPKRARARELDFNTPPRAKRDACTPRLPKAFKFHFLYSGSAHGLVFGLVGGGRAGGRLRASRVGWAVCLVMPLVTASEARDLRERALQSVTCDGQRVVRGIRTSQIGFGVLASLLISETPDDVIEIENFRGGRVECEDKVLIGGGESIGEGKDGIFIWNCNPNL